MGFARLLAFTLLLIALPIVFAASDEIKPKKTGMAIADIGLKWNIDLQDQRVSELKIKTFGFSNYPSQQVISEATDPYTAAVMDGLKNKIREFTLNPGLNYQSFSMDSKVKVQFTFDFPPATDASNYLAESDYVKITPEIKQKAEQISASQITDMDRAVAIAQWVHNNLRYDRNYINLVRSSDEAYIERAGTCDEFSHLFIAMLRSIGIPAKFSASYVYSGTDWGAHAFVEAAIGGKWIPFDPTFNEAILLDATHIKFGEGADQSDIKEDISIRSSDADVSRVRLLREFDLQFKETQNFPELFAMELILPEKEIGEGSIETVSVRLKNKEHRLAIPLSLLTPKDLQIVGENKVSEDKLVLLEPFEERDVVWKIVFPKLEEGYDYKFPVVVESLGQDANGTIRASRDGQVNEKEDLLVTGISAAEREDTLALSFTLKNTGNVDTTGVITLKVQGIPEEEKRFALMAGKDMQVSFLVRKIEPEKVLIGNLLIETGSLTVTQPFEFSLAASGQPSVGEPVSSLQPTEVPIGGIVPGLPNEYLLLVGAILLVLAAFFVRAGIRYD
ncbi:MAG: transglutaminase-like domain-containing protein [Candidatus Micrarchaeota archaeon]